MLSILNVVLYDGVATNGRFSLRRVESLKIHATVGYSKFWLLHIGMISSEGRFIQPGEFLLMIAMFSSVRCR